MQFLVVKLKCWNLCIRLSYIVIQRLLSLCLILHGECFDSHCINLPKNRRQYGTFVVIYKFGSNYPVAGFLRPDVDNNVSATGGWAARGALCASPPTRVIPCAPGQAGRVGARQKLGGIFEHFYLLKVASINQNWCLLNCNESKSFCKILFGCKRIIHVSVLGSSNGVNT